MMLRCLFILMLLPACALARSNEPQSVALVNACKELISMYDRDGQESTLVSWFGSVSEGMQAGYCRGVVLEFRRNNELRALGRATGYKNGCSQADWFRHAQKIANYSISEAGRISLGRLLEESCVR